MNYDAIIIGGGPAGAATAIPLARRGWNVVVVEKTEFPRGKVCGEFMSATNLALLDQLGVGNAWRKHAGPEVRRVGFFVGETCVEAPMPGARRGTFGRALGRDVLDTVILDKARSVGATVLQPWRAVAIHREGDVQAVRIETKGRDAVLRAPVVVAAHGSWEAGKLPSQLGKINRPSDLVGFKAHFKGGALPTDLMPLIAFPGGYGGMVWSDHGRLSISCCIRRDALAAIAKPAATSPPQKRCTSTSWRPAVARGKRSEARAWMGIGWPQAPSALAFAGATSTTYSASAMLPANRSRSSRRGSRWRFSRAGCSHPNSRW